MSKLIDLTYTIQEDMPTHPYDEDVKLSRHKHLLKDKYNDSRLEMGMHVGTHIDVPSHLINREELVSDYPVEQFIGKGCFLDVRNQNNLNMRETYIQKVEENDIVILYTGHGSHFESNDYFTQHPIMDKALANFFIDKKIKMIGMDLPSPDQYPFEIHRMLLENNILIIENLANLDSLVGVEKFEVMALPLKIRAEGAPVRVVARIFE